MARIIARGGSRGRVRGTLRRSGRQGRQHAWWLFGVLGACLVGSSAYLVICYVLLTFWVAGLPGYGLTLAVCGAMIVFQLAIAVCAFISTR